MVKKILFFTLSNFGDVVLTLPVLDMLRTLYPASHITVMVGPRPASIFNNNPNIHNLIIYDKYSPFKEKVNLFFALKNEQYDLVVDLRNSLFGVCLSGRFRTSAFLRMPAHIKHVKEQNLYRVKQALRKKDFPMAKGEKILHISSNDKDYINDILKEKGITENDKIIIVSPVAGNKTKTWGEEKFIQICQNLLYGYCPILIGREEDKHIIQHIKDSCVGRVFDFSGLTNLTQLAYLLEKAALLVACDTGVMHLASYLDVPVVGIFGSTDENRYGPWSSRHSVAASGVSCRPCRDTICRFSTVDCMRQVSLVSVLDSIDVVLKSC